MRLFWASLGVLAACESSSKISPAAKKDAVAVVADAAAADAVDASERKLFITGSGRCGECHVKMYDEWEVSGHAHAATSSLYKASVAAANNDPTCDRCHAPLAAEAPKDIIASEGVTCDVCHTLRSPQPSKDGGTWKLAIDDMVKYGPRCDLKDHYFHRMGCSPEHTQAPICGSCHWWEPKGIPVFTEYADWKAGPQAAEGTQCQGCHMPKEKAQLAEGSPVRTGVPHHGLLGIAGDLRKRALSIVLRTERVADTLVIKVEIQNNDAGHPVPAGLPEHRLIVRSTVRDRAGKTVSEQVAQLGRKLVDAAGTEVPFWRATAVGSDTRIAHGAPYHAETSVAATVTGTFEVDVTYRGVAEQLAKELGITEVEEHPMVHASIKLDGTSRTTTVKPLPPGKRVARKKAP